MDAQVHPVGAGILVDGTQHHEPAGDVGIAAATLVFHTARHIHVVADA